MNQENVKSLELSAEEKRAEERDRQLMKAVQQLNEGNPNPGLPPGAISVSDL